MWVFCVFPLFEVRFVEILLVPVSRGLSGASLRVFWATLRRFPGQNGAKVESKWSPSGAQRVTWGSLGQPLAENIWEISVKEGSGCSLGSFGGF